jgi:hypothetical protein
MFLLLMMPSTSHAQGFGNVAPEWEITMADPDGFRQFSDMLLVPPREEILLFGDYQIDATVSRYTARSESRVSRLTLRKLDRSGGVLWNTSFDFSPTSPNSSVGMALMENGDVLALGQVGQNRHGARQSTLARLNQDGEIIWQRRLGNKGDSPSKILNSPDGGFLIMGGRYPEEGSSRRFLYLVKLDSEGNYVGESVFEQFTGSRAWYGPEGDIRVIANRREDGPVLLRVGSDGTKLGSVDLGRDPPSGRHRGSIHAAIRLENGNILGLGGYIDLESRSDRKRNAFVRKVVISPDGEIETDKYSQKNGVSAGFGSVVSLKDGRVVAAFLTSKEWGPDYNYELWLFSPDGTLESQIPLPTDAVVRAISPSSDGTVVIAGWHRESESRVAGGQLRLDTRYFVRKMRIP